MTSLTKKMTWTAVICAVAITLIGCDGVIGSDKRLDRCGVCGGNDSTCHVISGIFTRTRLPVGYNRVTTVPRGACNINVTELVVSPNYLAIRLTDGPYVVNGDRDVIGRSGDFSGAGTVFSYRRAVPPSGQDGDQLDQPAVETILAAGPINASIDIVVVQQQENRGIMYSYTIPTGGANSAVMSSSARKHHHHQQPQQHQQHLPHQRRHGIRHHHHHDHQNNRTAHAGGEGHHPEEDDDADAASLMADSSDSSRHRDSTAADQPLTVDDHDEEGGPSSGIDQAVRPAQQQQQQSIRATKSTLDGRQGEHRHRRRQPKHQRRHHRTTAEPPTIGEQVDNEMLDVDYVVNDDPKVSYSSVVGSGPAAAATVTPARGQPGVNFGLSVQPRYVPAGQVYGVQPQGYPAVGWPYGNQQVISPVLSPYQSPAGVQYPPHGVIGSPLHHQPARSPYVQQQPYYVDQGHEQQSAVVGPSYYYGAGGAGGGGGQRHPQQQRRRRNHGIHHVAPLNDQYSPGGDEVSGGSDGDDDDDGIEDYAWKIAGFSECSQTCGGGFQQTQVVCMKVTGTQVVVTDENCDPNVKPTGRTVTCSNTPCPPGWESSDWTECSTTCDRGQQTRTTECRQRVTPTLSIAVTATRCAHLQRPDTLRLCNDDRPCTRWKIGEWSQCSTECGRGQRTREVICVNVEDQMIAENKCDGTKPRATEFCDMGSCARTWFYTTWSEECSSDCGDGVHHRLIHCSAEPQRCSEINRPKSEKPCKNERPCGGRWFTGPWSQCTVTCGEGVLERDVVCMKKLGSIMAVVGDENCQLDDKPETEQECERDPCQPRWYTTDWSECSRSCDTGLQNREAKCLDADQLPSQSCNVTDRPELRRTCNEHACSAAAAISSADSSSASTSRQSDREHRRGGRQHQQHSRPHQAPSCQDKFKNCRVVVQARLCRYAYYKDVCCFSCISHGYEP